MLRAAESHEALEVRLYLTSGPRGGPVALTMCSTHCVQLFGGPKQLSKVISPEQREAASPMIPVLRPSLPSFRQLEPLLRRIDSSGIYTNEGPLFHNFRDGVTAMLRRRGLEREPYVALASSGTTALELGIRHRLSKQQIAESDTCLMPSFTFVATAHAVKNVGLEPVLIDVDPESLQMTPEIAMDALNSLERRPRCLVVVSAFGSPVALGPWEDFERATGVPVVVDAAAAILNISQVSKIPQCVSLHATKPLGIGEGGMVVVSEPDAADQIQAMTSFGFRPGSRDSIVAGGNYRLSEYACAVGLAALDLVDDCEERLTALARTYSEAAMSKGLFCQPRVGADWVSSTFNVIADQETIGHIKLAFDKDGIQWRHWWGLGTHTHPAFVHVSRLSLDVTEEVAPTVLGIPFHTSLNEAQQERILRCLG